MKLTQAVQFANMGQHALRHAAFQSVEIPALGASIAREPARTATCLFANLRDLHLVLPGTLLLMRGADGDRSRCRWHDLRLASCRRCATSRR
jgi:hypothetical protein